MTSNIKNSGQPTLWNDKKIAPMSYCDLGRASRLLDCEIDDILHWGAIRQIQICVKLDKLQSELRLAGGYSPLDAKALYTRFASKAHFSHNLSFGDGRLSKFFSHLRNEDISNYPRTFQFGYTGEASGLWALNHRVIEAISFSGESSAKGILHPLEYDVFYQKNNIYPYVLISNEQDKAASLTVSDLFIHKKSMDKIYASSITGDAMSVISTDFVELDLDSLDLIEGPKKITLEGSLSVIGMMLDALKNAEPKNKRWIQGALKEEIKERHPEVNTRWLDDYFSEANKAIKS